MVRKLLGILLIMGATGCVSQPTDSQRPSFSIESRKWLNDKISRDIHAHIEVQPEGQRVYRIHYVFDNPLSLLTINPSDVGIFSLCMQASIAAKLGYDSFVTGNNRGDEGKALWGRREMDAYFIPIRAGESIENIVDMQGPVHWLENPIHNKDLAFCNKVLKSKYMWKVSAEGAPE